MISHTNAELACIPRLSGVNLQQTDRQNRYIVSFQSSPKERKITLSQEKNTYKTKWTKTDTTDIRHTTSHAEH